ncbi:hypothetical protein SCHPADRAFT_946936 [Schizopora paradoxa]|uniref:BTB domain-containing protein n=1 Tax=Schizopora paradoxa TaxID=27342 RepID=A0A0H2R7I7_9AGAM|nr:hypothetical protein SCHPADRAFT_946936 [Schizopora paradoxa]
MVPIRHEHLWFAGGDIILSTNTYLFKVHKDVLSLQSSVFRDMFELDEDEYIGRRARMGQELYEGLPLVALAGDKGEDVAHLLRAAYYREYYDRDDDQTSLETIAALLALSSKYDFEHIRNDVIKQISRNYPNSLTTFDEIDLEDYSPRVQLFGTPRGDCDFRLLEVSYTADADVLLPPLYYACCDFGVDWIFERAGRMKGDCVRTLIKGKFKLEHALCTLVASLADEFRSISCSSCKRKAYISCSQDISIDSHLSYYEGSKLVLKVLKNGCSRCSKNLEGRINEKRMEIWEKIPSYFGFSRWELESMDERDDMISLAATPPQRPQEEQMRPPLCDPPSCRRMYSMPSKIVPGPVVLWNQPIYTRYPLLQSHSL